LKTRILIWLNQVSNTRFPTALRLVKCGVNMRHTGSQFFNDEAVFATYAAHRRRPDNANDTLERPIFMALVGAVRGLAILDLGCGDGGFGREALATGCASYLGLEGAQTMVDAAQQCLAETAGQVIHTTVEEWSYPPGAFDLVVSQMALHYVQELATLFTLVHRTLRPGGRLIFSVEHPVITSCSVARPTGEGKRSGWLVDDYFESGPRLVQWLGGEVVKIHRTVEDYFLTLQATGFTVETLREARPDPAHFTDPAEYERRKRIPLMLFLVGRKG